MTATDLQTVKAREAAGGGHKTIMRSVVTVAFGNLFPPVASLLSGPILAQSLDVSGRGVLAAAMAPTALIASVVTFGLPEAVTYFIAKSPTSRRSTLGKGLRLLLVCGLLATLIVLLLANALSGGDSSIARLMLVASAAIVPNLMVGALRGMASAQQLWRLVTVERAASAALKLGTLVPLWLTGTLNVTTALVTLLAVPLVASLVYFQLLSQMPRTSTAEPTVTTKQLSSYGLRLWAGSVSGILLMRLDQLLLTPLASSDQLALYAVAVPLSELPLIINSAVRDVIFVKEAGQEEDGHAAQSARISFMACFIVALAIYGNLFWAVPLLYGDSFSSSIPVAGVLLLAVVLGTPGGIAGSVLSGRGRPGLRSLSLAVACAINVIVLVLLVPLLGALGAAVATLAGNLLAGSLNIYFTHKKIGITWVEFYGLRQHDLRAVCDASRRIFRRGR